MIERGYVPLRARGTVKTVDAVPDGGPGLSSLPDMTERVVPLDLGVRWEPNAPDASLLVDDSGVARLRLQPAPDEADGLPVLLTWSGVQAVRFGPYNDEGLGFHPLYDSGLSALREVGEVIDSSWLAEVAPAVFRPAAHHFIVPTKEALVEVLADDTSVGRESG